MVHNKENIGVLKPRKDSTSNQITFKTNQNSKSSVKFQISQDDQTLVLPTDDVISLEYHDINHDVLSHQGNFSCDENEDEEMNSDNEIAFSTKMIAELNYEELENLIEQERQLLEKNGKRNKTKKDKHSLNKRSKISKISQSQCNSCSNDYSKYGRRNSASKNVKFFKSGKLSSSPESVVKINLKELDKAVNNGFSKENSKNENSKVTNDLKHKLSIAKRVIKNYKTPKNEKQLEKIVQTNMSNLKNKNVNSQNTRSSNSADGVTIKRHCSGSKSFVKKQNPKIDLIQNETQNNEVAIKYKAVEIMEKGLETPDDKQLTAKSKRNKTQREQFMDETMKSLSEVESIKAENNELNIDSIQPNPEVMALMQNVLENVEKQTLLLSKLLEQSGTNLSKNSKTENKSISNSNLLQQFCQKLDFLKDTSIIKSFIADCQKDESQDHKKTFPFDHGNLIDLNCQNEHSNEKQPSNSCKNEKTMESGDNLGSNILKYIIRNSQNQETFPSNTPIYHQTSLKKSSDDQNNSILRSIMNRELPSENDFNTIHGQQNKENHRFHFCDALLEPIGKDFSDEVAEVKNNFEFQSLRTQSSTTSVPNHERGHSPVYYSHRKAHSSNSRTKYPTKSPASGDENESNKNKVHFRSVKNFTLTTSKGEPILSSDYGVVPPSHRIVRSISLRRAVPEDEDVYKPPVIPLHLQRQKSKVISKHNQNKCYLRDVLFH